MLFSHAATVPSRFDSDNSNGRVPTKDELTTSIVGIDFPSEDKSKSNRRMECMLCAPGDLVELRPEPKNPYDENAIAIWSERGHARTQPHDLCGLMTHLALRSLGAVALPPQHHSQAVNG